MGAQVPASSGNIPFIIPNDVALYIRSMEKGGTIMIIEASSMSLARSLPGKGVIIDWPQYYVRARMASFH